MGHSTQLEPRSVLFLIDVEPDSRNNPRGPGGWGGSSRAFEQLEELRKRLADRTRKSVVFNWFIRADPQIRQIWGRADWVADACPQLMRVVDDYGDYCGIHPH